MGAVCLKICNLKIHRYKSIEQLEMTKLDALNVLVGENGSGKTNILELLLLFFREFSRIGRTTSQLTPEHWYKREQSEPIKIHIDLEFTQQELEIIFGSSLARFVSLYLKEKEGYISISASLSSSGQWNESRILLHDLGLHEKGAQMELQEFLNEVGFKISVEYMYFVKPQSENEKQLAVTEGVPYLLDDGRKEAHRLDLSLIPYLVSEAHIELDEWWSKEEAIVNSNALSLVDYKIQSVNQNLDALSEIIRESLIVVQNIHQQALSPVRSESIPPDE
ncbi:unnamed protein product, partial [marine sediment metagenome]